MTNNLIVSTMNNNTKASNNSSTDGPQNMNAFKKTPNDFKFESLIGEGSFSTVVKAIETRSNKVFAIKICEKLQIRQEKMHDAIMREKKIMSILTSFPNPFLVKLYCSFQDEQRLYFVMNYAENEELLTYMNKVGSFDEECTRFYSAQILLALEHLHRLGIIHRDLKPENILLNEKMHIQITDFGSARFLDNDNNDVKVIQLNNEKNLDKNKPRTRKNSFVGTAQYISPEILTNKKVCRSTDLWALGCIIYQMTSGSLAFKGKNEYLIFQKILKLEYEFPDGFNSVIRNLIENFLKLKPEERLGAQDELKDKVSNTDLPYTSIRNHEFFKSFKERWDNLHNEEAPRILPYLPKNSNSEELRSEFNCDIEPGLDDKQMTRLLGLALYDGYQPSNSNTNVKKNILDISPEEFKLRLEKQKKESKWHTFVQNNLILKEGLINKRKGLIARKRMFLLTTGPHIYYVDPANMVLKGEIPWSEHLRPELKNFKNFFVHTPKRIFYLEDPDGNAPKWYEAIEDVRLATYCKQK